MAAVCGLAAVGLLASALVHTDAALAQGYGMGWWGSPPASKKAEKKAQRQRKADPDVAAAKTRPDATAEKPPVGPLVLSVSLKAQRLQVFDATGLIAEAPISSGRVGNPTPLGVFTILEKDKVHYSNLYGAAPMPNMNRITWSGVAMHAGVLPGYPASHGCIRLPHSFSAKLFSMTKLGHRVVVTREPVAPVPFTHAKLFSAFPPEPVVAATTGAQVADASGQTVGDARVSDVIGVSAANAAGASPSATPPAVTNAYREKWKAEMARLAEAVGTTAAAKTKAAEDLVKAAQAVQTAQETLKPARMELARIVEANAKTSRSLEAAKSDIAAFDKKVQRQKSLTEETAQKLGETEVKLEERIDTLSKVLDAASELETNAKTAFKDAEATATAAQAERKAAAAIFSKAGEDHKAAVEADAAAKRREAKRALPVSVFVSLKAKKLYIRQGYEPLLEVPVEIQNPEEPIGTHVFSAMALEPNANTMRWSVITVPTIPQDKKAADADKKRKKDAKDKKQEPVVAKVDVSAQNPGRALDRIAIPDDVREMIADLMKPGSSLLISDHGISNETGKFTDFIVSLR